VQKLEVVVENFAQEGWKFSCLRYGGGSIAGGVVANTLARQHYSDILLYSGYL